MHVAAVDAVGLRQRLQQPVGDATGIFGALDVVQQQHEFIAAEARDLVAGAAHGVGVAQRAAQAFGHQHQKLVARGVAHGVVHHLEAVEIEEQHRQHLLLGQRAPAGWIPAGAP